MHRFFVHPENLDGTKAFLTGREAHHANHVLRLKPGDRVELLDGGGLRSLAAITRISQGRVELAILSREKTTQNPAPLHLAIGLLKGKKMDLVIQKATELGVCAIHPFDSSHNAAPLPNQEKRDRWQRIAMEACKQCGRSKVPVVHPPRPLTELLGLPDFGTRLFLVEPPASGCNLIGLLETPPASPVLVLVGPEGGFSPQERAEAQERGFLPVSLGPLTLRAETAAIVGVGIVQFLLSEFAPGDLPATLAGEDISCGR